MATAVTLEQVFNHVVLPPYLPDHEDTNTRNLAFNLIDRLTDACDVLLSNTDARFHDGWRVVKATLKVCFSIHENVNSQSLLAAMRSLPDTEKRILICHIEEQNAALLIHRDKDAKNHPVVIFEAFEASPRSQDVLAAPNSLLWTFPSRAVQIPLAIFEDRNFQDTFASFIEKASQEEISHLAASVTKAGASVKEERNTTNPALISHMLLSLLQALGSTADVRSFQKRVRDDVCFNSARMPWRRLPFWLILRVSLQRQLDLVHGPIVGKAAYKILVNTLVAKLLGHTVNQRMEPDMVAMLQKKLGRRLAKFEQSMSTDSSTTEIINDLSTTMRGFFRNCVNKGTEYIKNRGARFKQEHVRKIPKLPQRVNNSDTRLQLSSSSKYLDSLLKRCQDHPNISPVEQSHLRVIVKIGQGTGVHKVQEFEDTYVNAMRSVDKARDHASLAWQRRLWPEYGPMDRCSKVSVVINNLVENLTSIFLGDPENMSIFLLNIFDLWTRMDAFAIEATPMLEDYAPLFGPELLDQLQLPTLQDMKRLRRIQSYLRERKAGSWSPKTIFGPIDENCFGTRYEKNSPHMTQLHTSIAAVQKESRDKKQRELERLSHDYDRMTEDIARGICMCSILPDGRKDVHGCKTCYLKRRRRKMRIQIYENLLPDCPATASAVVFELAIPLHIANYRTTTWKILARLAYPTQPKQEPVMQHLHECQAYSRFAQSIPRSGISIASSVKSTSQTHFKKQKMKTELHRVLVPLALEFRLYDRDTKQWVREPEMPMTLAHICGVHIPRGLEKTVLPPSTHPHTNPDGPSSYAAVASRPECPSELSAHEFEAFQRVLSGTSRRWLTILTELGSSNLNLSKLDTVLTLSHLIHQVGPDDPLEGGCTSILPDQTAALSVCHAGFANSDFVTCLIKQVSNRISTIRSNWRESNLMELLITILLRCHDLSGSKFVRKSAMSLLQSSRSTTLEWINALRPEVALATDGESAQRASLYALKAALLCRRTFTTFVPDRVTEECVFTSSDLCDFVRASIALQQSLVVDIANLSQVDRNMLVRDSIMAHKLKPAIEAAMDHYPQSLSEAVAWGIGQSCESFLDEDEEAVPTWTFGAWERPTPSTSEWTTATTVPEAGSSSVAQRVDLHYVSGHLLVNGQTIGKLPIAIRDSPCVKELFGDRHLLTYPSALMDMSYQLAAPFEKHEIHLGLRNGKTVIVARNTRGEIFEHVPREIFTDSRGKPDLPRGLLDDCVHWFSHKRKILEIRREPSKWKFLPSHWKLDIRQRTAQRRKVHLVDPDSPVCKKLAKVFGRFEDAQRLTVFQPTMGDLSAEFRHLDLSFVVSSKGRLVCNELGAEVDPNQDAGCLYGFQSMVVLRDIHDYTNRSMIVPLGTIHYNQLADGVVSHTVLDRAFRRKTANAKGYVRYGIDQLVGRLTCHPEPVLLFTKVLLHAVTSLPEPDPLTGRTGEEEAIHSLQSGRCQPMSALDASNTDILEQIKRLAPIREFYPPHKRVLQTVFWNQRLPASMQNDRYARIVNELLGKEERLRILDDHFFTSTRQYAGKNSEAALSTRGELQHQRVRCLDPHDHSFARLHDLDALYVSLGCSEDSTGVGRNNIAAVSHVVRMLVEKKKVVPMHKPVPDIFDGWQVIGGFGLPCNTKLTPISTLMDNSTLGERFGSLLELCRNSTPDQKYDIMFGLSLHAFSPKTDMDVVRLLAAISYVPELKSPQPPPHVTYSRFNPNELLTLETLENYVSAAYIKFTSCAKTIIHTGGNRKAAQELQQVDAVRYAEHQKRCESEGLELKHILYHQWPEREKPDVGDFHSDAIDVDEVLETLQPEWERLRQNNDFSDYLSELQSALQPFSTIPLAARSQSPPSFLATAGPGDRSFVEHRNSTIPCLRSLIGRDAPAVRSRQEPKSLPVSQKALSDYTAPAEFTELKQIVSLFSSSSDILRQTYGQDLSGSLVALEKLHREEHQSGTLSRTEPDLSMIRDEIQDSTAEVFSRLRTIGVFLSERSGTDTRPNWLEMSGLWPRLTPVSILELLRSCDKHVYGSNGKELLVSYGRSITELQRRVRIRRALRKRDSRRATEENANRGHENWDPIENPDWLLMEIDSDLLIRAEQVDVANAIISPESRKNSLMQLNMGKGKTSCIVPMAMAVLADGTQVGRLIVPKALILQTSQVVKSRLGGLVGRELRLVPFSRRTASGPGAEDRVALFEKHHNDLLVHHDILLAAPEHVLAFKLSGLQCLVDNRLTIAGRMIDFQTLLSRELCRDVLDESDFTLAVRTQLVYPSGQLTAVDGAPHRWRLVEALLALVEDNIPSLCQKYPHSIEVIQRSGGGFPMIYILHTDIEDALHQCLVESISSGQIPFFRPSPSRIGKQKEVQSATLPRDTRKLLEKALTDTGCDTYIHQAASLFPESGSAAAGLLLVRGLLMHKILLTCLKKRWNVQYGLHPKRWPIAVPFEAKGVPSERSEFGHPDVAIIFTCLSFYYSGLSKNQFREGLQYILKHTDDPATEYERWASGNVAAQLPESLVHWNVINVDDEGQVETLWKYLCLSRPVIDHYLNTFVFPVHAHQFSVKLQASAWDLPIFNPEKTSKARLTRTARKAKEIAEQRSKARTTGFSGTNDNKMMLPMNVQQDDLPSLRQTNAEVLTYLLQARNRNYVSTGTRGCRWTEDELLQNLVESKTRILIDAGAYILEKDNESLVKAWLKADKEAPAAVFFGENDNRAWVKFRNSTTANRPLLATPFVDRLDRCLVYFDEAHTRGVDLLLPREARGALTLALGQTKDHTVQAAMRLRQLGSTQSVVFFAPPEVEQSIVDVCSRENNPLRAKDLQSPHVVTWLLEQTCRANEQMRPLYLSHGFDFCRRTDAHIKHCASTKNMMQRRSLLKVIEQQEHQTLAQLYGSTTVSQHPAGNHSSLAAAELQEFENRLRDQQQYAGGDLQSGQTKHGAFEEVEQEREVEFQVEQVRQKQKPHKYSALSFTDLHVAILRFVQDGILSGDRGYEQVFKYIGQTDIGKRFDVRETASKLYVSSEFQRTIGHETQIGRQPFDDFLRPVEWVLWSPSTQTALIVIPEEIELLIRELQKPTCKTHLLVYASPVTRSMIAFSGLRYFAVPSIPEPKHKHQLLPAWLEIELGILAGRLYMTYEQCMDMKAYLDRMKGLGGEACDLAFCDDPTGFLLEWLPLRRVGQDIMHTPAAYICQGRPLRKDHPFFVEGFREKKALRSSDGSRTTHASQSSPAHNSDSVTEEEEPVEEEEEEGADFEDEYGGQLVGVHHASDISESEDGGSSDDSDDDSDRGGDEEVEIVDSRKKIPEYGDESMKSVDSEEGDAESEKESSGNSEGSEQSEQSGESMDLDSSSLEDTEMTEK